MNVLQDQACRVFLINLILAVMIGLYCLKAVRQLPRAFRVGYLCSAIGVFLNWLVINVNGQQMPVLDYQWVIPAGTPWRYARFGDRLLWLADRFPYHNFVFSIGDVGILLGAAIFLAAWARCRYQLVCSRKSAS